MRILKTVLVSLFTIGLFFSSNAQTDANGLIAKLADNFLTANNNKTIAVFDIAASEAQINDLKAASAKFTKHCSLKVENTSTEMHKCALSFDKYEQSVSNYGFVQKMLLNYNINYFEYKGTKYHVRELINITK